MCFPLPTFVSPAQNVNGFNVLLKTLTLQTPILFQELNNGRLAVSSVKVQRPARVGVFPWDDIISHCNSASVKSKASKIQYLVQAALEDTLSLLAGGRSAAQLYVSRLFF